MLIKRPIKIVIELNQVILEDIFYLAQQVDRGEITSTAGRDKLVISYGLNPNLANMSIRFLRHLLNGKRYRRALTLGATDYVMRRISNEYGSQGMNTALRGLFAHIEYRK